MWPWPCPMHQVLTALAARYYYTQFIGHPINRPTILGCASFSGIGLIDTDPYIPRGQVSTTTHDSKPADE